MWEKIKEWALLALLVGMVAVIAVIGWKLSVFLLRVKIVMAIFGVVVSVVYLWLLFKD